MRNQHDASPALTTVRGGGVDYLMCLSHRSADYIQRSIAGTDAR